MNPIRPNGSPEHTRAWKGLLEELEAEFEIDKESIRRLEHDSHRNVLHVVLTRGGERVIEPKESVVVRAALCMLGVYELCDPAAQARLLAQHQRAELRSV